MKKLNLRSLVLICFFMVNSCAAAVCIAAEPQAGFVRKSDSVLLQIGGQTVAEYVYRDDNILRPYFAHIKTLTGKQVSRNHPPVDGVDKADHPTMHPGIWLSFGDINGNDYWRLKARTQHIGFDVEPQVDAAGVGRCTIVNSYLAADGQSPVCLEHCHISWRAVPAGFLLTMSSKFMPAGADVIFGDQEEMGLGIRVATPLSVEKKLGGRILDNEGRRNGQQVWGQVATWCDYSGPLDGRWAGMTVLVSPKNFRSSWSHARDYGFVAMNPFGLQTFTKAPRQDVRIKSNENLHLGYAVVVHETQAEAEYAPESAYAFYVDNVVNRERPFDR